MAASPDPAALTALITALDVQREQLANQASGLVQQAVVGFTDWYNAQAITQWAGDTASMVDSVLRSLAYMVDAFLAEITGQLAGRHVRPSGPIDVSVLRQGITGAGALGRVADAYRFQQSLLDQAARDTAAGTLTVPPDLVPPVHAALDRAEQVTDLNTQLVVRNQSAATMQAQRQRGLITGWRRVPHPELSKTGTCGLCWAASTRIYHTGELMPIHHSCHCLPMPITAAHDIGSVINDSDFAQLYGDAGGTDAAALKRTRYQVTEHGELGPLLTKPGPQRTARQAKAAENPRRQPSTPGQKRRKLQNLHDELASTTGRLDQLVAEDPTWAPFRTSVTDRIANLEQQLTQAA